MSSTEKVSLLRQSYSEESYTTETVGFGLGMAIGLGGSIYEGYKWTAHSSIGWPLVGFITTCVISTFGLIRARQHDASQQSSLKGCQIDDIQSPADSGLSEISTEVARLLESFSIEVKTPTTFSIQKPSPESEQSKVLRQLKCLEQYQKDKDGELSQALEQVQQLRIQVEKLSEEVNAQKYIKQIEELESTLRRKSEELRLEKETVEQDKIQLAFFQAQISKLNEMVQDLSKSGLQSPSANVSFEGLLSTASILYTYSREGSRVGSRSNSAPHSPFKPPASPITGVKSKTLFSGSNIDSTGGKNE